MPEDQLHACIVRRHRNYYCILNGSKWTDLSYTILANGANWIDVAFKDNPRILFYGSATETTIKQTHEDPECRNNYNGQKQINRIWNGIFVILPESGNTALTSSRWNYLIQEHCPNTQIGKT